MLNRLAADFRLLRETVNSIRQSKVILTTLSIGFTFIEYNSLAEIIDNLSNYADTLEKIADKKQKQVNEWLESEYDEYQDYENYVVYEESEDNAE